MRRKAFLQAPFLIVLAFVAVLLPIASILVDNKQEAMILGVHTGLIPTVRPTTAPATSTSNSCVGEGGVVANGTAGCCSGLTKQNCSGSGSFVYCYCKKPVTNPIATPIYKVCTVRSWVGGVCSSKTYTIASNLSCAASNCTVGDPTPRMTVTPIITVMPTLPVGSCRYLFSGINETLINGQSKCYNLAGQGFASSMIKCTNGSVSTVKNYVSQNCVDRTPTLAVGDCSASGGIPALFNGQSYCESPYMLGSRLLVCNNGVVSVSKNFLATSSCTDEVVPTPTTYQMPIPTPTNIPVRLAGVAMGAVKTWLDTSIFKCWQSSGKPDGCTCSNNLNCASQNCVAGKCQIVPVNPINEVPREVIVKPTRAPIWFNVPWFKCWPASGRPDNCSCEKDSRCASQNCNDGKCQPIPEVEVVPQPATDCVYGVDYNGDGIVNSIDMMQCLQDK